MLSKRLFTFHRTCSSISRLSDKTKVPKICSIEESLSRRFDEIIDVRTHAEYLEDHIPGAINLPVLDEAERHAVGSLHASDTFQGHKTGASLVSTNIGRILEERFLDKPIDYRPLIYCWRGGLRSHSLAVVLANVGFDVVVLEGGHKKYRERVREDLETLPAALRDIRVISGPTGSGKSKILRHLEAGGAQVLDLEYLAKHKGSVLGQYPDEGQPKQKRFESLIWRELRRCDPDSPLFVESESKRIGNVHIPTRLFEAMTRAPRIELVVPLEERIRHTIEDYDYFVRDPDRLKACLAALTPKIVPTELLESWNRSIDEKDWPSLVESLLVRHYDPNYLWSQTKNSQNCSSRRTLRVDKLNSEHVNDAIVPYVLTSSTMMGDP